MITVNYKTDDGTANVQLNEKALDRFFDAGLEFNIKLTNENISKILNDNPDIAFDTLLWGNDTAVGDNFFEALVKEIMGISWDKVKEDHKDNAYAIVTSKALLKGYKKHE